MSQEHYRVTRVPGGRIRVTCRRCFRVTRSGWRRHQAIVSDMADVGAWVDQHTHTPFTTVSEARAEAARINGPKWLPHERAVFWEAEDRRRDRAQLEDVETLLNALVREHGVPCARCGSQTAENGYARNSQRSDSHVEMIALCAEHGDPTEDDYHSAILSESRIPDFATMTTVT